MKIYKKTFWSGVVAILIGSSCCWISTLAVWLGGATLFGTLAVYLEDYQVVILCLGGILIAISILLYIKRRRTKP